MGIAVYGRTLSARQIARALGSRFVSPSTRDGQPDNWTHIINYGWCYPDPPDRARVLNEKLISNKLVQLKLMFWDGVPTPRFSQYLPHDRRARWLGRRFKHARANDIMRTGAARPEHDHIVPGSAPNPDYYVEFVRKTREFRVHVVNGLVVRMNEKLPRDERRGDVVWNSRNCHFSSRIIEPADLKLQLRAVGKAAVRALEYDFGAADVIYHPGRGLLVLEVNSAPTLIDNQNTLGRYVEHFRAWIGG
jgi:hypothetical protein